MCGIVGYVGEKQALEVVVEGLRRLEYRGYDSAGVAIVAGDRLETRKKAGKLANLESLLGEDPLEAATLGIGHTRWATHGGPTDSNAHPHVSEDGRVAVIHNGIIENFAELREELTAAGVVLSSETDTEVVAHLLAAELPVAGVNRCLYVRLALPAWVIVIMLKVVSRSAGKGSARSGRIGSSSRAVTREAMGRASPGLTPALRSKYSI